MSRCRCMMHSWDTIEIHGRPNSLDAPGAPGRSIPPCCREVGRPAEAHALQSCCKLSYQQIQNRQPWPPASQGDWPSGKRGIFSGPRSAWTMSWPCSAVTPSAISAMKLARRDFGWFQRIVSSRGMVRAQVRQQDRGVGQGFQACLVGWPLCLY